MEQLRVKRGIEINVNDNGDTIMIDVENALFMNRFVDFLDKLDEISKKIDALPKDINDMDAVKFQAEEMEKMVADVDTFIGADTCAKVFGKDVIPTVFAMADFFSQLIPIVSKYADERNARIMKEYSPNRRGGKK